MCLHSRRASFLADFKFDWFIFFSTNTMLYERASKKLFIKNITVHTNTNCQNLHETNFFPQGNWTYHIATCHDNQTNPLRSKKIIWIFWCISWHPLNKGNMDFFTYTMQRTHNFFWLDVSAPSIDVHIHFRMTFKRNTRKFFLSFLT